MLDLGHTKLAGPAKWTYYYLYSIIDTYSRYTVGWMVATRESKDLAERLLGDSIAKQDVDRGQLTLHADRGSSMASKPVAFLLADLGVTKSHSRPHCSNPFSACVTRGLASRCGPERSVIRPVACRHSCDIRRAEPACGLRSIAGLV